MEDYEIEFEEWLRNRPETIKALAAKLKPWFRYRVKPTGQHCNLYSYSEDGTVTVEVNGHDSEFLDSLKRFLPVLVFGINPDDLEILV